MTNEQEREFNIDDELAAIEALIPSEQPDLKALNITIGALSDEWFELKKKLDEMAAEKSAYTKRQEQIEETLLKLMHDNAINKISSKLGSITRKVKVMPSIKNMDDFMKWVAQDVDNRLGFIQKKVNESAVSELMLSKISEEALAEILIEDADYNVINEQLTAMEALPPGVNVFLKPQLNKRKK